MLSGKTNIDRIFPAFVRPKEDELLSSWILRTAFAHGIKAQSFGKSFLNNKNIWNRDIDRSADIELLKIMSQGCDTKIEKAFATTLISYEGYLFQKHNAYGNTKFIMPVGIYHRKRKRYGQQFCPLCLKKDGQIPFYRRKWRLSLSTLCVRCGVQLEDRCKQCLQPITFFRQEIGMKNEISELPISSCFHCRFDLRHTTPRLALQSHIKYQKWINQILDRGYLRRVSYSHLFFETLYKILGILISKRKKLQPFKEEVRKHVYFKNLDHLSSEERRFDRLRQKDRYALVSAGCWILQCWPSRFIFLCKKTDTTMSYLTHDMNPVPYWYYEVVSKFLSKKVISSIG